MDLVTVLGELGLGLLQGRDIAGADRDVAAGLGDAHGDRLADAAAAAADDGLLAREVDFHDAVSPRTVVAAQFADRRVSVSTAAREESSYASRSVALAVGGACPLS